MASGRVRTRRTVKHSLAELAELHRKLESGDLRGQRVVIDVNVGS